ncbi:hypothetical protein [Lysinibacillus fusiformis]|uniref:hypothetical protein n=1 Tax=Lysinibacillus fusiformis TaxID=28031 RepID=UPI0020C00538|nr:hypothetical protein [Lysinibacillus fusiformis]
MGIYYLMSDDTDEMEKQVIKMKSVNFQLDGMDSIEITQLEEHLFEVRLVLDGKISMQYMNKEELGQLGATFQIGNIKSYLE